MGITGLDRLMEYRHDEGAVIAVMDDLEYGRCEYVLAVPDSWLDVTSVDDLADLALEFHERGRQLRIATSTLPCCGDTCLNAGLISSPWCRPAELSRQPPSPDTPT